MSAISERNRPTGRKNATAGSAATKHEARSNKKPQDHAASESHPSALTEPGIPVYWILKRWGGTTAATAEAWGLGPAYENPQPHEGLCQGGYLTPQELMKDLRQKDWKPSQFTNSPFQCFARVDATSCGFTLVCFPSYTSAVADHNDRVQTQKRKTASLVPPTTATTPTGLTFPSSPEGKAEGREIAVDQSIPYNNLVLAAKQSDDVPLKVCPFCRCGDLLEEIDWSNERADGSEYIGPAIRCNRCDAIAPAAAWMNRKGGGA